jgi:hypothetical protein
MNWGEFKQHVEESGVEDEMEIESIDVYRDAEPEVVITPRGLVVIYQ